MFTRKCISVETQPITLRWFENCNSGLHQELAQMVQARITEAIIRCTVRVKKDTPVNLIGKGYKTNGVVRSCRREGNSFILRVLMDENLTFSPREEIDPGALTVESFLTEEEEAKILNDLAEGKPRKALSR